MPGGGEVGRVQVAKAVGQGDLLVKGRSSLEKTSGAGSSSVTVHNVKCVSLVVCMGGQVCTPRKANDWGWGRVAVCFRGSSYALG